MEQTKQLWNQVLDLLKSQLSRPSFETWLQSTKVRVDGDKWIIFAPNEFSRDWIENRYQSIIKETIYTITNQFPEIIVSVDSDFQPEEEEEERLTDYKIKRILSDMKTLHGVDREKLFSLIQNQFDVNLLLTRENSVPSLNTDYTFENFMVGSENRFALTGAKDLAKAPGKQYNPFFIYGAIGSGKTHLLQAIGNYILKQNQAKRIIYCTAAQFMNDFIESIQNNAIVAFRNKYIQADVFLFDDVQDLAGKERTQKEFFYILEILLSQQKQIVMTADRAPIDIPSIDERLVARFQWGLIIDIRNHGTETQKEWILQLCDREQIELSSAMIDLLAAQHFKSISEIHSALKTIMAYKQLIHEPLDESKIAELLHTINNRVECNPKYRAWETEEDELSKRTDLLEGEVENLKNQLNSMLRKIEAIID